MDRFIADSFWSGTSPDRLRTMVKELRAAARHLPRDSGQLRLLRCTLAPADELCIWAFEADSEATVRALGHAVGLELDRISLAVDVWPLPRWSRR